MKKLFFLVSFVFVFGCASPGSKMNRLSLGMTKSEVIDVMGDPDTTKAAEGIEYLVYRIDPWAHMEAWNASGEYWAVIENGKLTKYGRPGDFNTTEAPTTKVIIEDKKDIKIEEKKSEAKNEGKE